METCALVKGWVMRKLLFSLILVFSPAMAFSQEEVVSWGTIGNWDIMVDRTTGDGCFIIGEFKDGTSLRAQLIPDDRSFMFMLANEQWRSIEPGKIYQLRIQFDRETPWDLKMRGVNFFGTPAIILTIPIDSQDTSTFIYELKSMNVMAADYNSNRLTQLSLSGTSLAMDEMVECQAAVLADSTPAVGDPFVGASTGNPDDPFAQ